MVLAKTKSFLFLSLIKINYPAPLPTFFAAALNSSVWSVHQDFSERKKRSVTETQPGGDVHLLSYFCGVVSALLYIGEQDLAVAPWGESKVVQLTGFDVMITDGL